MNKTEYMKKMAFASTLLKEAADGKSYMNMLVNPDKAVKPGAIQTLNMQNQTPVAAKPAAVKAPAAPAQVTPAAVADVKKQIMPASIPGFKTPSQAASKMTEPLEIMKQLRAGIDAKDSRYGSNFWTDLLNMIYKLFGSKRTFATKEGK